MLLRHSAAFVLDCSTIDRLGDLGTIIESLPTGVIDHHSSGEPFGTVSWVDSKAPATCYLIFQLIQMLGIQLVSFEAELLLFGLATDTGFFRHLGAKSQDIFAMVSTLSAAGASPKETYARMYGNRTLESRTLLGRLLARAEQVYRGRLIITFETLEDTREFGLINRDSDTLYMLLQGTEDVEVVLLIREEKEGECSVGLRSKTIDVGLIAREFGGGGHANAAGFTWQGAHSEINTILKDKFSYLESYQS
jgi:phosphoesterase RecJ-like protein